MDIRMAFLTLIRLGDLVMNDMSSPFHALCPCHPEEVVSYFIG